MPGYHIYILSIYFIFNYAYVYPDANMYTSVGALRGQQRTSDLLELQLQSAVSSLRWVLGAKSSHLQGQCSLLTAERPLQLQLCCVINYTQPNQSGNALPRGG